MTNRGENKKYSDEPSIGYEPEILVGIGASACVVFVLFLVFFSKSVWTLSANEIGDFLAGFFAFLGTVWVVVAVLLQRRELRLQRFEIANLEKATREQAEATLIMAKEQKRDGLLERLNSWRSRNQPFFNLIEQQTKEILFSNQFVRVGIEQLNERNHSAGHRAHLLFDGSFGIESIEKTDVILLLNFSYSGQVNHQSQVPFESEMSVNLRIVVEADDTLTVVLQVLQSLPPEQREELIEIFRDATRHRFNRYLMSHVSRSSNEGFAIHLLLWSRSL